MKKDPWVCRFLVLLSFVLFDFLVTWVSVARPIEEGNVLARAFMQFFGIYPGLVIFGLFIASFLFTILFSCKLLFTGNSKWISLIGSLAIDVCFGWFIAGGHFVGGTSWFWLAPELVRHCLGAGLYLLVLSLLSATSFWNTLPANK
jgi:hypothetical protein